ncbi:hypothetical protein [Paenibacillus periandrae]|uniref:hypothetical protein n=1 Tax=Paenibacillus periandrae TaxID=1761741 RepID=UPI001F09948B|nr:hypothetical protein [Paenibacillus periandrae]
MNRVFCEYQRGSLSVHNVPDKQIGIFVSYSGAKMEQQRQVWQKPFSIDTIQHK